jgi:hypothetical protein
MLNAPESDPSELTIRELLGLRNRLFDQERADLQRSLETMANEKGFSLSGGDLLVVPRCTDTQRMEQLAPVGVKFSRYVEECYFIKRSPLFESPMRSTQFEGLRPLDASFSEFTLANQFKDSIGTLYNVNSQVGPAFLFPVLENYFDDELAEIAKSFRELPARTKQIAEQILARECVSPIRAWYRALGSPRGESRRAMKRFIRDLKRWEAAHCK